MLARARKEVMLFTANQLIQMSRIFMVNFIGKQTTDDYTRVARWLLWGQPGKANNDRGGHRVYAKSWTAKEAAVLWLLISRTVSLKPLTKTQIRAYERRQKWLEQMFRLNALELTAAAI